jgi:hypothetical protein
VAPIVESADMTVADRKEKYSLDFFCFVFFVKKKNEVGERAHFHFGMMFGQSPEKRLKFKSDNGKIAKEGNMRLYVSKKKHNNAPLFNYFGIHQGFQV